MQTLIPHPGSEEAESQGCTCPMNENQRGEGAFFAGRPGKTYFLIESECPLHGLTQPQEDV